MACKLLALSLLGYAHGYVILPGGHKYASSQGMRWATSTNNSYDIGLTGGIAFAYSPSLGVFCSELTHKMKENGANLEWASCEQIENAVMRAMATWAANHQMIKFVDVTQACVREAVDDPRILLDMRYCSQAELIVSAGPPASDSSTVAALVTQYNDQYQNPNERDPLGTAGRAATNDWAIQKTTMHFHTHFCWYLDNTFCGSLHSTYETGIEVDVMMAGICFGLWVIGFFAFLLQLFRVISSLANTKHKSCEDAIEAVTLQVSDCLAHNKMMMLLLIICPVVYMDVIDPCFSCYDFEAAVAHELGHVLGFGHTDQFFVDNLQQPEGLVMDSTTCTDVGMAHFPYDSAGEVVGMSSLTTDYATECYPYSTAEAANAAVSAGIALSCVDGFCCDKEAFNRVPLSSIMYSLTTHSARPCLAQDDLDGLNFLYPSCEYARQTSPVCIRSERNIGYIRFALNVLIPFTAIALTSQLLFTYSYRHHTRKELRNKWKIMGRFVSVEDAAALCVQSHFRKHHAVLNRYKRDVMAIILQSAMRGAVARVKLAKHADFANVALAVHRDVELQASVPCPLLSLPIPSPRLTLDA